MIGSCFDNIAIEGIATAVPTNIDIIAEKYGKQFGDDSVSAFCKTTGVLQRRVTMKEQTASDLAYIAARKLIDEKHIDVKQIGICIFVTQHPDYIMPSTACVLHKRLVLSKDCIAFDINLGCSGYVYGLQIASSLLQNIDCRYALLLVGDTMNEKISERDASSVMLFGEAGAATLLRKSANNTYIKTALKTDGNGFKTLIIPAGACRNTDASNEFVEWGDGNIRSDYNFYMNGVDVFSFSITEIPKMIHEFMLYNNIDKDEIDCYAFHQGNLYMLKQIAKKSKLDKNKMHISLDRYGNTSVTSIPLTLCDCYGNVNDRATKKILSCGFGIGLSWGIATFTVQSNDIYPIIETDDYYKDGGVSHD